MKQTMTRDEWMLARTEAIFSENVQKLLVQEARAKKTHLVEQSNRNKLINDEDINYISNVVNAPDVNQVIGLI